MENMESKFRRADFHVDAFEADPRVKDLVRKAEEIDIEGQLSESSIKKLDLMFASVWDEWESHEDKESQRKVIDSIVALYETTSYYHIVGGEGVNEKLGTNVVLHLEGCDSVTDAHDVDYLYGRGIRSLGLLYNHDNKIGGGALSESNIGLTDFGRDVVARAASKGMVIDLAHANERTTRDTIALLTKIREGLAPAYSHGAIKTPEASADFFPPSAERLLSVDTSLEIAKANGIIGIGLASPFFPSIKNAAEQIKRLSDVHGNVSHLAIGTDFGGFPNEMALQGMETLDRVQVLADLLADNGFSDQQIAAIMGENLIDYTDRILKRQTR